MRDMHADKGLGIIICRTVTLKTIILLLLVSFALFANPIKCDAICAPNECGTPGRVHEHWDQYQCFICNSYCRHCVCDTGYVWDNTCSCSICASGYCWDDTTSTCATSRPCYLDQCPVQGHQTCNTDGTWDGCQVSLPPKSVMELTIIAMGKSTKDSAARAVPALPIHAWDHRVTTPREIFFTRRKSCHRAGRCFPSH